MFSIFKRKKVASTAKNDWWLATFTQEEQTLIEDAFTPVGNITAELLAKSADPSTLSNLAGHLKQENLRHLGYRILERADALVNEGIPIISLHFYLQARGQFFYRWRDMDEHALDEAIESFRRQIGLASNAKEVFQSSPEWQCMPAHAGYRQLRIIEEKRGNLTLAKELCLKAKSEGWADDWDKQIARIDKKIEKAIL